MNEDTLAIVQGSYFAATGIWSLVDIESFEAVTGPKVDKWLVRTVGVLVTAIGGALISAGVRHKVTGEIKGLGVGSAIGLAAIDLIYTSRRRIAPIYLADAAVEATVATMWINRSVRA